MSKHNYAPLYPLIWRFTGENRGFVLVGRPENPRDTEYGETNRFIVFSE
jgi:hypothetical protein